MARQTTGCHETAPARWWCPCLCRQGGPGRGPRCIWLVCCRLALRAWHTLAALGGVAHCATHWGRVWRKCSMANWLATSPALCPPMPSASSASTQSGASVCMCVQSSLLDRTRPTSLKAQAAQCISCAVCVCNKAAASQGWGATGLLVSLRVLRPRLTTTPSASTSNALQCPGRSSTLCPAVATPPQRGRCGPWCPPIQPSSMPPAVMMKGKRSINFSANWLPHTMMGMLHQ